MNATQRVSSSGEGLEGFCEELTSREKEDPFPNAVHPGSQGLGPVIYTGRCFAAGQELSGETQSVPDVHRPDTADGLGISGHLTPEAPLFRGAWEIYEAAFAADDRRSPRGHTDIARRPNYRFCAVIMREMVVGVVAWWTFGSFTYVEHMAIHSDWRSQGLGSRVFRKLAQVVAMPIVVDVAPPEEGADARRRIAFYQRMGFGWNEGEYLAPAYEPDKNAKSVRFMSWPGSLSAHAFDQVRDTINEQVYGQALLPWPPLVMAS